jgi:putative drug exporter of the RND superfamily
VARAIDAAGTSPAFVTATALRIPGIRGAVAPDSPAWRRNGSAMVAVLPAADRASTADQATATAVRRALASVTPGALVGGTAVSIVDQVHSFYGDFPWCWPVWRSSRSSCWHARSGR